MSDEMGDGSFGYLNHIASYVSATLHCVPAIPPRCRPPGGCGGTLRHGHGCAATNRLGACSLSAWRRPIGPDLLDVLRRYVHACTRSAIATRSSWCGCCWRQGSGRTPPPSPRAGERRGRESGLSWAARRRACTRARSLTMIPTGRAAVQAYRATLGRWSARRRLRTPAGCSRKRAKDEAVGYLDEALRLQSAAGAERDAARVAACSAIPARSVQAGAQTRPRRAGRS